jgi:ABC-type glycerol-3-phosphate transport system substrate-binding protein
MMRWDLYEKLGKPQMADFYEMLDVIEDMLELEPETRRGLKTYGLGWMGDWGVARSIDCIWMVSHGMVEFGLSKGIWEGRQDANAPLKFIGDDDSQFKAGLQWYFDANQRGLVDPDSKSYTWTEFNGKSNEGQYMLTYWDWWTGGESNVEDYWGYASVWPDDAQVPIYYDAPIGSNRMWSISAACAADPAKLDAALRFTNWMWDLETQRWWRNGPEGLFYEYNEDGVPQYTDTYYAQRQEDGSWVDYEM